MSKYKGYSDRTQKAYASYVAVAHQLRAAERAADEAEAAAQALSDDNDSADELEAAEASLAYWATVACGLRETWEQAWATWEEAAERERKAFRQYDA